MSSTRMRQPSCSPKNVTLLPTTGPRSSRSGVVRRRAGWRGTSAAPWWDRPAPSTLGHGRTSAAASVSPTSARAEEYRTGQSASGRVGHDALDDASTRRPSDRLRLSGLRLAPPRRRAAGCRRWLPAWPPLRCMSTAAAEVRAFGDRHARRDDVAVDRAAVADVDLLGRGDVAGDLAEHDHRLGEHLRLDLAVGADRQRRCPSARSCPRRGLRSSGPRCRSARP